MNIKASFRVLLLGTLLSNAALLLGSPVAAARLEHSNPRDIPNYKQGDLIHTEAKFEEFLDLMITPADAKEAYEIAKEKFGPFPLRFAGPNFKIMIISFRRDYLRLGTCNYPMIAMEYITYEAKPGSLLNTPIYRTWGQTMEWTMIYPRTGPIIMNDIAPWNGSNKVGTVLRGGMNTEEAIRDYCREAGKPPSYPRY